MCSTKRCTSPYPTPIGGSRGQNGSICISQKPPGSIWAWLSGWWRKWEDTFFSFTPHKCKTFLLNTCIGMSHHLYLVILLSKLSASGTPYSEPMVVWMSFRPRFIQKLGHAFLSKSFQTKLQLCVAWIAYLRFGIRLGCSQKSWIATVRVEDIITGLVGHSDAAYSDKPHFPNDWSVNELPLRTVTVG